MGKYIVTADFFRIAEKGADGKIIGFGAVHGRNDVIEYDDEDAKRLVASGGLKAYVKGAEAVSPDSAGDDVSVTGGEQMVFDAPAVVAPSLADLVREAGDTEDFDSGDTEDEIEEGEDASDSDESDDSDDEDGDVAEDDLEALSFAQLQKLAKSETGDGSGSKADLIARINEHRTN